MTAHPHTATATCDLLHVHPSEVLQSRNDGKRNISECFVPWLGARVIPSRIQAHVELSARIATIER